MSDELQWSGQRTIRLGLALRSKRFPVAPDFLQPSQIRLGLVGLAWRSVSECGLTAGY
jgi:hypothetical protein